MIGNANAGAEALFDELEEKKSPNRQKRKGRNATPRKILDEASMIDTSPSGMGKTSVKTRQANAAAGRLQQMTLD